MNFDSVKFEDKESGICVYKAENSSTQHSGKLLVKGKTHWVVRTILHNKVLLITFLDREEALAYASRIRLQVIASRDLMNKLVEDQVKYAAKVNDTKKEAGA